MIIEAWSTSLSRRASATRRRDWGHSHIGPDVVAPISFDLIYSHFCCPNAVILTMPKMEGLAAVLHNEKKVWPVDPLLSSHLHCPDFLQFWQRIVYIRQLQLCRVGASLHSCQKPPISQCLLEKLLENKETQGKSMESLSKRSTWRMMKFAESGLVLLGKKQG